MTYPIRRSGQPYTRVWIGIVKPMYDAESRQKVARAPKAVLESMLEQMVGEGPHPVWDGLMREKYGEEVVLPLSKPGRVVVDVPYTETELKVAAFYAAEELPIYRTEAGYPDCATCDGGGCPDCTDPA